MYITMIYVSKMLQSSMIVWVSGCQETSTIFDDSVIKSTSRPEMPRVCMVSCVYGDVLLFANLLPFLTAADCRKYIEWPRKTEADYVRSFVFKIPCNRFVLKHLPTQNMPLIQITAVPLVIFTFASIVLRSVNLFSSFRVFDFIALMGKRIEHWKNKYTTNQWHVITYYTNLNESHKSPYIVWLSIHFMLMKFTERRSLDFLTAFSVVLVCQRLSDSTDFYFGGKLKINRHKLWIFLDFC